MAAPLARTAARRPRAWRAGRRGEPCVRRSAARAVALALGLLAAGAAGAARLVDVRVGQHPEFVRVVFETDAPAAFSIERGEQPGERRVRIEAGGAPARLRVPADAGAEVTLEPLPDGATLARIRAAAPVRIESQVLDRPPRIVFDLRPGAEEEPSLAPAASQPQPGEAQVALAPGPLVEPPHDPERPAPLLAPELQEPALFPDLARPLADAPLPAEPGTPDAAAPEAEAPAVEAPALELPAVGAPEAEAPAAESRVTETPAAEAPAVSAPPPAAIAPRLDDRSLLVGAAGGVAVGLGLSLLARGARRRGEAGAGAAGPPAQEPEGRTGAEEGTEASEPEAPPPGEREPAASPPPARIPAVGVDRPGELGLDLLRMLQRLEERLAALEETLQGLAARTERLELRGGNQSEELATQRVALARLQLAVAPPGGVRADPGPRREAPAGPAPSSRRPS